MKTNYTKEQLLMTEEVAKFQRMAYTQTVPEWLKSKNMKPDKTELEKLKEQFEKALIEMKKADERFIKRAGIEMKPNELFSDYIFRTIQISRAEKRAKEIMQERKLYNSKFKNILNLNILQQIKVGFDWLLRGFS